MNKKQKILIVHNYYQIPGGEDTVVDNEKKLLKDNGHKVVLYTRHNSEIKNFNNFQKLLLPLTSIFSIKTYKEIKKIIKEQNIDIVHVHNTLTLISHAVYYASVKSKIPVVQTIHNFRLLCPGATFYRDGNICEDCLTKGLKCAVKNNCYRESKLQTLLCVINTKIHRMTGIYKKLTYICLTEFNKEKLLQHGQIKEEQVYVKVNFCQRQTEIIPYQQRENQFVFVGRIDSLKGVDILIEAWKCLQNKEYKLIICGTGPMQDWCKDYSVKNNIANVEFRGFVPNEQVKKIIANSKALILPTQWYEGFPMTIVEAYAVGTPVIGSNIGNAGNVVIEEITGCKFIYNSSTDLANKMEQFEQLDFSEKKILKIHDEKYSDIANYKILNKIYKKSME